MTRRRDADAADASRPAHEDDEAKARFIQDMGAMLAAFGLPDTAARILAALLVATPAEQSAAELARTLGTSRASISTMTRLLEGPGLIERVRKPGVRKVYYRNTPDGWFRAMQREAESMGQIRAMAERGAELMKDASDDERRGIEDTVRFLRYWEREMEVVMERWRSTREREGRP